MKILASVMAATAFVALAGAASAHDPEKKIRTVVIHNDGKGGRDAHVTVHDAKCDSAVIRADVDVETPAVDGKKQRTRVLICNSDADPAKARAQVIKSLEKARAGIAGHDSARLSAEHRAKALAALDREIAKLRAE